VIPFRLEVRIKPRAGLLDPQGKAVHHALQSLGYGGVSEARVGKAIDLELSAANREEALALGEEMCRRLLANPVTEDYELQLIEGGSVPGSVG